MKVLDDPPVRTLRPQDLGIGVLFWTIRDAVVVGDSATGRIVLWNPAAESLFGYTADGAVGMLLEALVPEGLRGRHRAGMVRYAASGHGPMIDAGKPVAVPALRKDGTQIAIELSLTPLPVFADDVPDGRYVLAIIRDATQRQRAAEANSRLAAIVESTDDAIIGMTPDGVITTWNVGAERLYRYAAAEIVGRSTAILIPMELRGEEEAILARVTRGERIDHFETERVAKDGRRLQVSLAVFPIRDADGVIMGVASIARDITDYWMAEARLREAETRYRILVERIPAATYLEEVDDTEPKWTTRYVSPQIEAMLGYPVRNWLADPEFGPSLLHPADRERVLAEDARTDATGEPFRVEYRMIARDSRIVWIRDEAVLVRDDVGEPRYWLGFMLDISEQRRADVERAALLAAEREYARRLEELATVRADFTAMVAHELGSRIAAVRRWADLLASEPLSPDQEEALAMIQAEAASLRVLLTDAQAAATVERDDFTVVPRRVPVEALLADATAFARTLPGDHPLLREGDAGGYVLVDPGRIGQVLRNLLSNAAKYAPPGAPITLRVTQRGERIRIEVIDRGFGIHPDDLPRVFEKFGRGMDASMRHIPGVGVGLYLSRRIAQAHGADLTVVSTPGAGSTFGFDLAVAP